jgi:uncharacterized GH25 family protein
MRTIRQLLCIPVVLSSFVAPLRAAVIGTVINIDGKAISGAKVSLFGPELISAQGPRMLAAEPQRKALLTSTSDSSGRFSLDVPKDQTIVDVRVEAAGYAPGSIRGVADDDLGAMLLTQAGPVRGTVTANGKPVANATVVILGGAEYVTKTDADGHYTAPDPSKWAARIYVVHSDFAMGEETFGQPGSKPALDFTLTAGLTLSGRVVAEDGQTPVGDAEILLDAWPAGKSAKDGTFAIAHARKDWETVEARIGNRIAQRVRVAGAPVATLKLAAGSMLTGSVRDVKSQLPIAGARVALAHVAIAVGRRRVNRGDASIDVVTDAKGNFAVGPLPPGTHEVRPTRPGYAITGVQSVNLKAGETAQKVLYGTARGRISGSVIDENNKPVAAAHLATRQTTRNNRFAMIQFRALGAMSEGYSAPDGHFVLRNVETDADIQVDALKRGFPGAQSSSLKLASGEKKTGVTITIPRGVAVTGKVTDKDHKPLSGVAVEATEATSDNQGPGGAGVRRIVNAALRNGRNDEAVRTGSDGTFSMRVKAGTYDLDFKREGFSAKTVRGTKVDAASKPVEVILDPGVEIAGRITRSGAGLEGVDIRAISQDGMASAISASDGSFTLTDLSPGQMMLIASKQDSFIQEMRAVTAPTRDLVIDLPAGGRITGHVVDKNSHEPVTSFQAGVTTSRSGGGMVMMMPPMQKQFTSDDGSFVLEGIKAGSTQVIVNAPGYTTARVPNIEVADGKTAPDVEVDVETGAKLTGRVTTASGSPLPGVAVSSNPMGGGGGGRVMRFDGTASGATTDPSGEYSIDSLEPGELTLTFSLSGYVGQQKSVTIASGKDNRLDVQLSNGMTVTGSVVSDGGTPVADAMVRAMSASEMDGVHEGRSDGSGAFSIDGLAPGHFTFTVSKAGFAPTTVRDVDIATSGPVRVTLKNGGVITGHINGLTGQELDQATVTATLTGGGGPGGGSVSSAVDGGGNFRIDGAPSGTVRVSARTGTGFGGASKSAAPKTVELDAGGTAQVDIDFISSTVIQGRVTRNGMPIANAQVGFSPRGGTSQTSASAPADANGHYSVSGLDNGTYTVQAMDVASLAPFTTQYEVHGSDTFDITIKSVSLYGNVVDATTTNPLANATVELQSASGQGPLGRRVAQTDAAGTFTIDNVAAGPYQITADKTNYGHDIRTITVADTPPDAVQFKLSPSAGITITAVDTRDNTPLTVSVTRIVDSQGNDLPAQGVFSGSNEIVTLSLAPGAYQVTVVARNYASQTLSMTSPSQQTVRFSPGGTIVLHHTSTPVRVRLINASGVPYGMNPFTQGVITVQPGAMTLNNVAAGQYQLQILDSADRVTGTTPIQVVEGQQNDINV